MINSKLVNILRTFSVTEMKEFEKFAASPFFNMGRNYLPFLKEIKKFYPKFDDEKLTSEYLFSKIYPSKKFNKQIMWNINSQMLSMAEDFLVFISLGKNKFRRKQHIASELIDRRLTKYYKKKVEEMEADIDIPGIGASYFRNKAEIEDGKMDYHFIEDTQQFLPELLDKKGDYTILNFLRELSDTIGSMRTSKSMYNKQYDNTLSFKFISNLDLKKIVQFANETGFKYAPVLNIYYESIMLSLDYENKEHYYSLKQLFEKNHHIFTKDEKQIIAAELTNYCVQKINEGDHSFRNAIFELDKFKLKEELVFISRQLPKVTFMQILGNALYVRELEWAKNFIEEYIPKMRVSYQKPTRALCYAHLYYVQKDYGKVLENLSKAEFIDSLDKIYVRTLYIRTYFEMKEFETLRSFLDTAKHFYEKNPHISNTLRANNIKFVNCMNKLVEANETGNIYEIEKIIKSARDDKNMANKEWIIEKAEEIKKGAE